MIVKKLSDISYFSIQAELQAILNEDPVIFQPFVDAVYK